MEALAGPVGETPDDLQQTLSKYSAFDLKGVMASVTVLRLKMRSLDLINRQLRAKTARFPEFFENAPVVVDFSGLDGSAEGLPLDVLVRVLRSAGVVPAGVAGLDEAGCRAAQTVGLPILRLNHNGRGRMRPVAQAEPPELATPAAPAPASVAVAPPSVASAAEPAAPRVVYVTRPPLVIRQAVRSGQEIYAQGTDLIVMAPVNPGAHIVADGHIHIYGPMRGRALAGASGYLQARIFCQMLDAELVSIGGAYVTADDIPDACRKQPAQIFLQDGECQVVPLV